MKKKQEKTFADQVRDESARATAHLGRFHDVQRVDATGNPTEEVIDPEEVMRVTPDRGHRMIVTPRHLILGGLVHDEDAESPLTACEGNGQIFHRGRWYRQDEISSFCDALGLDADGAPRVDDEAVKERRRRALEQYLEADPVADLRLRMLLARARQTFDARDLLDDLTRMGRWTLDAMCECVFNTTRKHLDTEQRKHLDRQQALLDAVQERAWKLAQEEGAIGKPYAVPLDLYDHGGIHYSISGEGMQCQFDTMRAGAVWVPCDGAIENIEHVVNRTLGICVRWAGAHGSNADPQHAQYSLDQGRTWEGRFKTFAEAGKAARIAATRKLQLISDQQEREIRERVTRNYCQGVLDELNAWGAGENYGVLVYAIDRHTGELLNDRDTECWGFTGTAWAEESLEDVMLGTLRYLLKNEPAVAPQAWREAA